MRFDNVHVICSRQIDPVRMLSISIYSRQVQEIGEFKKISQEQE